MALIEVNWNPDTRELRRFAWISVFTSAVVAGLAPIFTGLDLRWCVLILCAGGAVGLSPLVSIRITRAVYRVLVGATMPIGLVVSFLFLSLFYFCLITPIGLFFRLIGRDVLRRRFDPGARTYWLKHHAPDRPDRYFQQF